MREHREPRGERFLKGTSLKKVGGDRVELHVEREGAATPGKTILTLGNMYDSYVWGRFQHSGKPVRKKGYRKKG